MPAAWARAGHGLQQGGVLAEGVPQPQACKSPAFGEGPQDQQILIALEGLQQSVGRWVVQKVVETLVHSQQCAAGSAAIQNLLQ